MEIKVAEVRNDKELEEILILQEENHKSVLAQKNNLINGFLTVKHRFAELKGMNDLAPQIIAKADNKVVAFALVMLPECKDKVPLLVPMFNIFKEVEYKGRKITEYKYYVMGQICVGEKFRSLGIFDRLYEKHKEVYSGKYEICVTEISSKNLRSVKAHARVGFEKVYTFTDESDEWNIVVWDWK